MRIHYAIVYVSDMKRSIVFYEKFLGTAPKFQTPGWTEFATAGATIALHATAGEAGQCRPGLRTPNLNQFHREMTGLGIACVRQPAETFGTRMAQYADPDGLVISVSGAL